MDGRGGPIIIDNGSGLLKAGFSGETSPSYTFRTIVGRATGAVFVGNAPKVGAIPEMKCPIDRESVTNWDDMEKVWDHAFSDVLRIDPAEHSVVIGDTPWRTNSDRIMQIMFEVFSVPSLFVGNQAALALYSTGRLTGVVLDIGYSLTSAVPIVEGYAVRDGITKIDFAGKDLTSLFELKLGVSADVANQVKEKVGFTGESDVTLSDGTVVSVGDAFQITELLFTPPVGRGVHELVLDSVNACDEKVRNSLMRSVVLVGGTTMLSGFPARFESLLPTSRPSKVVASAQRDHASWIGGSILSCLAAYDSMAVTEKEYNEDGPGILLRKCL